MVPPLVIMLIAATQYKTDGRNKMLGMVMSSLEVNLSSTLIVNMVAMFN